MSEKQPSRTLASMMLGPTFMSQVRALNKQAVKINLRATLGSFPDNRDVPPELVQNNPEYPKLVASPEPIAPIDEKWYGKPVAIIGAGAAGLCAGYELMRSGIVPVFFEMQREPSSTGLARAGGRAYSTNLNADTQPPVLCDLGCMRFPKSHTTLRTYTDEIFKDDYKYRYDDAEKWVPFLDPLLFDGTGDIPQNDWKVVYDTVFFARGINNRKYYRVTSGTTFADLPDAIQDVSVAFGDLLFGAKGIMNDLVAAYASGDTAKITDIWSEMNATYQDKSIFEVLRNEGWEKVIKGDNNTSRLSIFGELGLGSGGFDAFWGTTFMEILRIKIHEDEVNQDAFVGGSSFMLSPFLTHKVACADLQTRSLSDITKNRVILSPVTEIRAEPNGGVRIITENNKSFIFPCAILTAAPTAISTSISIDEDIFSVGAWNGIRNIPLTGSGKTFLSFPTPFWKKTSKKFPGKDAIVTTVTDNAIRQVYAFDEYHWKSGSKQGALMLSYTWGDWAHKMGSLSGADQAQSAVRMLKEIYADEWGDGWDDLFLKAIQAGDYYTINWTHERGFAGGYRMADLNRYPDQQAMWQAGTAPARSDAAVFLIGEATAWLGLSGWVEGALHTGINATVGVGAWFKQEAINFENWDKVTNPDSINGTMFAPITTPVGTAD